MTDPTQDRLLGGRVTIFQPKGGYRAAIDPVLLAAAIPANAVVMDAVYDPEDTRLLRDARDRGARPLGGKWMLVYQAAEQFHLWTGKEAPLEAMAEAFDAAGGPLQTPD